jgi:hypothetical protein
MRTLSKFALVPAFALLAACGRDDRSPAVDDALQNDLALAAAAQPYQAQQFVSPLEQGYAGAYAPQYAPAGYAPAPQPYYTPAAPAPVRRAPASRPRATSTASSGTVYRAPAPAPAPVIKNTKRDAVIGSVAGAAIGVATSSKKDRLKGGLLGAVAGAAIGAVVGNNVDVQRP